MPRERVNTHTLNILSTFARQRGTQGRRYNVSPLLSSLGDMIHTEEQILIVKWQNCFSSLLFCVSFPSLVCTGDFADRTHFHAVQYLEVYLVWPSIIRVFFFFILYKYFFLRLNRVTIYIETDLSKQAEKEPTMKAELLPIATWLLLPTRLWEKFSP